MRLIGFIKYFYLVSYKKMFNYNQSIASNFKILIAGKQELEFFATTINIPTLSLSPIEIPYQDVRAKVPDNRFMWDDLTINFILDEEIYSYELLKNWMYDVRNKDKWATGIKDVHIIPLDSNKGIEFSFLAEGAWPNMIAGWQYTSTSTVSDYITFDVTFSYQNLDIRRLTPLSFSIID